jgi:hypothetical protein
MPRYQNTSVDSDRLIIGNWKIETAASAGATYVNLGAGQLTAFSHEFEKFDVQAGNAPDPIEGIAQETVTFGFDLIEYDASAMSAMQGGLVSAVITTGQSVMSAGGQTELTPRAFRLTNTRMIGSATVETVITVFKATVDNGATWVTKSDNDTDPVNALQFAVTGEIDAVRTAGTQLYTITRVEV